MTTSLDKTTIKSGSNRAATINPLEDCSSRHAGAHKKKNAVYFCATFNSECIFVCVHVIALKVFHNETCKLNVEFV